MSSPRTKGLQSLLLAGLNGAPTLGEAEQEPGPHRWLNDKRRDGGTLTKKEVRRMQPPNSFLRLPRATRFAAQHQRLECRPDLHRKKPTKAATSTTPRNT